MANYDNVTAALARYNTMTEHDSLTARTEAWHGIAERLICAALCNLLRGQALQFVADRANDALLRAGVTEPAALWRPRA